MSSSNEVVCSRCLMPLPLPGRDAIPQGNGYVHSSPGRCIAVLRQEIIGLRAASETTALSDKPLQSLCLTGYQIEHLADFVDRERDTELTLAHFPERSPDADGNEMPAGLYAWFTEYPDEGALHLAEQPESPEKADEPHKFTDDEKTEMRRNAAELDRRAAQKTSER